MAAYATRQDSSFLSTRAIVLIAIIVLHVLLAYGLATGLARRAMEIIAPPIQTTIVEDVQKHDLPPPPPPPEFERPPVDVPPPDINIDIPAEPPPTAITQVENTPVKTAPPARPTNRTNPGPGKNFPNTADYYPAASMRLGEEGSSTVHACVAPNGRLSEEPTIAKTSGSARLDEGALKLAKAGHYNPGTEDGKPITACINFSIKFQLKN